MRCMDSRPWKVLILSSCMLAACSKDRSTSAPAEAVSSPSEDRPPVESDIYVSTQERDEGERDAMAEVVQADAEQTPVDGDFAVRSPERALEIAEAAVAAELDPKLTWKPSPILPASWPSTDKRVVYLFYPLSAHPHDMSQFHLFTPSYEVEVNLEDGTSEVHPIRKRQRLGVIEDRRSSLLEREELELAQNTLVRIVLAGHAELGDNNLWGYLKYFHENPELARDIKRRSPEFVRWVENKKRH